MLIDIKLNAESFKGKNVKSLPDHPSRDGYTAAQLKAMFDSGGEKVIAAAFNAAIDILVSAEGARNIGTANGNTLQGFLDRRDNPHEVNKSQVGLGRADDTPDLEKPVSMPSQQEISRVEGKAETELLQAKTGIEQRIVGVEVRAQNEINRIEIKAHDETNRVETVLTADIEQVDLDAKNAIHALTANVLTKDNDIPYTPTGDFHPVTVKKLGEVAELTKTDILEGPYFVNPKTGEIESIQTVLNSLYNNLHNYELLANEYDGMDLSAEGYDKLDLSAEEYDESGKLYL